jgi:hypothetical protein
MLYNIFEIIEMYIQHHILDGTAMYVDCYVFFVLCDIFI